MFTITEKAASKINELIVKRGKGLGVRIGVKTTGCSGLAYVLEYVDDESDLVKMCINNAPVYIAEKDEIYIRDLTVDYVVERLSEGFKFINPAEKDRCGCGASFRI
jgi:iron-sulfur cluster assembly protein